MHKLHMIQFVNYPMNYEKNLHFKSILRVYSLPRKIFLGSYLKVIAHETDV